VLPCSSGVDATVVVKNPCEFPIEFYSLDFDKQYLQEEKILRAVRGHKSSKTFLMPPRAPGETLPPEVLQYFEAQKRLHAQKAEAEAEAKAKATAAQKNAALQKSVNPEPTVEVIENPITQALKRHVGMDTSPESKEAPQHRGVLLIIHGAPLAGKTATAAGLCKYYGIPCLSIDTVVREAIASN
ncbi:HYDIN protein, partial [Climacteris rufus]|nr:HYDIN protein [Climacteris rufus]